MGWSGDAMQGKALSFWKYRGLKGLAAFSNIGLSAAPKTPEQERLRAVLILLPF